MHDFVKLPNSRFCFACGLENKVGLRLSFYDDGEGKAVGEYAIAKEFESYPGMAHGGIVATIMDEALIRALILEDHNRLFFTAKLTTRSNSYRVKSSSIASASARSASTNVKF